MIPRQLLHDDRSPFFGSFTRYSFLHSSGVCSLSQIFIRIGWIISVEVWTSAFSATGGMPPGPAALPDFKDLMVLLTSALVGGLVFTSSWFPAGGMSGGTWGGGLLRISWKCSAHLALSLASSVMVSPFLSFTGLERALFFPDSVVVISYSLFMSLLPAAVSAYSVRSCMKPLLSALVLFLTCRFNSQYWACRSCFCCRSWVWFISFFSCFLSLMRIQVLHGCQPLFVLSSFLPQDLVTCGLPGVPQAVPCLLY